MTWIKTVSPEHATGQLSRAYAAISAARHGVADIHRAQSLNPRAMLAHMELYKRVMFAGSSLSRTVRERLAVVVSARNRCIYCVRHHAEALLQLGETPAVASTLSRGDLPAVPEVSEEQQLLLAWAQQRSDQPWTATEADLEQLREAGLDDQAILDAALVVAYFSFVNRLVLLLGVQLEPDYQRYCGDSPAD